MSNRSSLLIPSCIVLSLIIAVMSLLLRAETVMAWHTPDASSVTIAGSLQEELGCSGDWQPDCEAIHLTYDTEDDVWQGWFNILAGMWEYKAALNNSWNENYGLGAQRDGANIPLDLANAKNVKFYYDHKTHWITDNVNSAIIVAPGDFQTELGCSGDWDPGCLQSWLQDPDGNGINTLITDNLPAGNYQVKVAYNESWDLNYGEGGVQNGANIDFTVPSDCATMLFEYNRSNHVLTVDQAAPREEPNSVTIPGSFQSELGCPGDWQPDCALTHLSFDAEDTVWQGTFSIPAGNWEYKAALNDSWDENYGDNATRNGLNIGLSLADATTVKFYYDHGTNWITSSENAVIATLAGSFQSELGCSGDWQPWCLRSWLQDPDGDGIYTFSTGKLPAGNYEVKVAHNESWDVNYGDGGVQNGANIPFTVPCSCSEIFFSYDPATHILAIYSDDVVRGNLNLQKAHWVSQDTIAWNPWMSPLDAIFKLHYAQNGGMALDQSGVIGADGMLTLTLDPAGLPSSVTEKFPHLAGYKALKIGAANLDMIPQILKGQIAVSVAAGDGTPLDATSLQIPGVLDDLFPYSGKLGVVYNGSEPTLKLWAPTARSVTLHLFNDPDPSTVPDTLPMIKDPTTGVWSSTGDATWTSKYYLYGVEVYVPSTGKVKHNIVTDPYSLSLAANSARSQIVNLDDPALKPPDWDSMQKPSLTSPEDMVIYELHVRDFSLCDTAVADFLRGTFKAFNDTTGNGVQHLNELVNAGLTHVQLLPSFDFADVPERRADQMEVDPYQLAMFPPDSDQQQAAVMAVQDQDGYNWGYAPMHYTVPEGSYATNPDGTARILEFREMIQALNQRGLRVVMDVVYNHTQSAGQNSKSVLDKIVPGYYYRLDANGNIEMSSGCPNTASEHAMMEKLMIDSLLTWARAYKVDGFRFDLMGHHSKANMLNFRAQLDALTDASDGVDGSKICLYGEGWNFGEVANNARFLQATQVNMAGTGIGTFNDRLRDGVRGGNPFSNMRDQGFITGLYYDSNNINQQSQSEQLDTLLHLSDWIRISMTGNLKNFTFKDQYGNTVTGEQIDYFGQQAGYTLDPQEAVNYISSHDNQTLFDAVQIKSAAATNMADRVRVQNLGLSIVTLGQGIPFIHAGMDMLRSKSMDRDSFNSGDWFNKLDFTYQSNNWGVGLPLASNNQDAWPIMQPLLANPALMPAPTDMIKSVFHFREMLEIRKSSGLFHLPTEAEVSARLAFHNTGPSQIPGLIVMSLTDDGGTVDQTVRRIVVLFNASDMQVNFDTPAFVGELLELHPVQAASMDPVVRTSSFDSATGTFTIPARTTSVFVAQRSAEEQITRLEDQVDELQAAGILNRGQANALISKLNNILQKIDRGRVKAACNQLMAFIQQVTTLAYEDGILTENEAQPLIEAAINALAALDCPESA